MRLIQKLRCGSTALMLMAVSSALSQTATPAQEQKPAVVDDGKPAPGDYRKTQGQTISGFAAPYVSEYAAANNIDLARVARVLLGKTFSSASTAQNSAVLISSYEYNTGDWTFFRSATVRLYELRKVRAGSSSGLLLVLYNRLRPVDVIIDRFVAQWRLALLKQDYSVASDVPFTTRIKHQEQGLWDTITTGLSIESGEPLVRILYVHSGGGGGRDQEFTARFAIGGKRPRLKLTALKQTLDEYQP